MKIKLKNVSEGFTKNIALKDLTNISGDFPIYGASGYIKNVDFYIQNKEYIGIVKDGAGVGRVNKYPAYSSLLGTMQYILPNENVDIDYLKYAIQHLKLEEDLSGAAIPHIYFKNYSEKEINFYNLKEQKNISKILNVINNLIDNRKKQLFFLDELIKSRFNEMFENKILDTKNQCKIKDIATETIGLTYKPANVSTNGTIVLRSGNIQNNELYLEDDIVRVSNIAINDSKYIHINDILMCSRNGSARLVGKSCLIKNIKEPLSFGAFMTVIRTQYPYFLQAYFCSDYFKQQLTGTKTASVNQITTKMLNDYSVIEPTKEEEKTFSEFVKQIDKSKFVVYSKYFLCEFLTLKSSTIAYSKVVSILVCPNKC